MSSDADLNQFPGSGTLNDPFIIAGYSIRDNSTGSGAVTIALANVRKHVLITSCQIFANGSYHKDGVQLVNTTNTRIESCFFYNIGTAEYFRGGEIRIDRCLIWISVRNITGVLIANNVAIKSGSVDLSLNSLAGATIINNTLIGFPDIVTLSTPIVNYPEVGISFSADIDGGVPPIDYQWSFGDGTPNSTGSYMSSHVYFATGVYGVVLTITDAEGDRDVFQTSILVQKYSCGSSIGGYPVLPVVLLGLAGIWWLWKHRFPKPQNEKEGL